MGRQSHRSAAVVSRLRAGAAACGLALLLALAPAVRAGEAASHPLDAHACPVCRAALEKASAYLDKHFETDLANDWWYRGFLSSFWGGFYYLMDGAKEKEARICAAKMCKYMDIWVKKSNGYEGWFCSMAMLYLGEFSLRYGATPEIRTAMEWGAKYCHKTREPEGGWFHGPRWGGPNYALDISSVGCGYFAALQEMAALGMDGGLASAEAASYVDQVCDGRSVAYGLHGRGGFSLAASSYLLIGLTSSGRGDDPRVKGIGGFLLDNLDKIRSAHASGNLHHFGVAAALHRVGPDAYARFAGHYLHQYFIANQADDGSIAPFPNDSADPPEKAYAALKQGGDFPSTAILAAMLMLERPGAFSGTAAKKPGSPPNPQCFKRAQEAIAKGALGEALVQLAEVLPCGSGDELVPRAQAQRRLIDGLIRERTQALQESVEKAAQTAAGAEDGAADQAEACQLAIDGYEAVERACKGAPPAAEAKARLAELRKTLAALRIRRTSAVAKRLAELKERRGDQPVALASPEDLARIAAAGAEPAAADGPAKTAAP
jgi:hypothetical protein